MFAEKLQEIAARVAHARIVSLVADDGIPVETHGSLDTVEDGSTDAKKKIDLEALAAELLAQVRTIGENHRELRMGEVEQFSVSTEQYTAIVGRLTPGYFLLMVLAAGGGLGKARFELRRAPLIFEGDL